MSQSFTQLFDSRRGDSPFRISSQDHVALSAPTRLNYFSVWWIKSGSGTFHADLNQFDFAPPALLFANPYQTVFISSDCPIAAERLDFHANFFCIETYHEQVGCNGILFNDIYGIPVVPVGLIQVAEFDQLIAVMRQEISFGGIAHSEVLLSYLKIFLVKATRLKAERTASSLQISTPVSHVLSRLIEVIETNYHERHRPSDYARLLGISEKALNKLVRNKLGKTLTTLIRERVLKHAKWNLLHTRKPVKEVAREVGFRDELYFSRVFKRATGLAPTEFRDFETEIRGGRNLSM